MNRTALAGIAVFALTCPTLARTGVIMPPASGASEGITLAPAQRIKIKQYVVERRVPPATISEPLAVGATIPGDVELLPVHARMGVGT
jgi:hypothetical protein